MRFRPGQRVPHLPRAGAASSCRRTCNFVFEVPLQYCPSLCDPRNRAPPIAHCQRHSDLHESTQLADRAPIEVVKNMKSASLHRAALVACAVLCGVAAQLPVVAVHLRARMQVQSNSPTTRLVPILRQRVAELHQRSAVLAAQSPSALQANFAAAGAAQLAANHAVQLARREHNRLGSIKLAVIVQLPCGKEIGPIEVSGAGGDEPSSGGQKPSRSLSLQPGARMPFPLLYDSGWDQPKTVAVGASERQSYNTVGHIKAEVAKLAGIPEAALSLYVLCQGPESEGSGVPVCEAFRHNAGIGCRPEDFVNERMREKGLCLGEGCGDKSSFVPLFGLRSDSVPLSERPLGMPLRPLEWHQNPAVSVPVRFHWGRDESGDPAVCAGLREWAACDENGFRDGCADSRSAIETPSCTVLLKLGGVVDDDGALAISKQKQEVARWEAHVRECEERLDYRNSDRIVFVRGFDLSGDLKEAEAGLREAQKALRALQAGGGGRVAD